MTALRRHALSGDSDVQENHRSSPSGSTSILKYDSGSIVCHMFRWEPDLLLIMCPFRRLSDELVDKAARRNNT